MKRYAIPMLLVLVLPALAPGSAAAIEGFRGQTWGEARQDLPRDGDSNLLVQGWVRQGVDWAKWGNLTLNTYGTLRYQADTEKLDYNNSIGPGLGISLEAYSPKGVVAAFGVEYLWDRFFQADRTDEKVVLYVNWYGWWDLKKR
jgi:hypothetical protein